MDSYLYLKSHDWIAIEHSVRILKAFYDEMFETSGEKTAYLSKTSVLSRLMIRHLRQYVEREKSIPEIVGKLCNQLTPGFTKQFLD